MVTGIIKTEENAMYSKEVIWSFHDLETRVEEKDYLLCDVISIGQDNWLVSLHIFNLLDSRYINISLSRITVSGKISPFSSTYWHAGILDKDQIWQYDRSGFVNQKVLCNEWITVAEWSGPELTYMVEEKDLYMPDGRFQFILQFCWHPNCSQKDSEGTVKKPIDVDLKKTDKNHYSKSAFWIIDDLQGRLEEDKSLLSDTFVFGGHLWRLSLGTVELLDTQYIDVALSRFTTSKKLPPFPFMYWHSGILDRNDTWDYYRSGQTTLDEIFAEWTTVTDWSGPELRYLYQEKDLYMPHNLLTIAFCLQWTPERKKISKTVGRLETEVDIPQYKKIFWKIDDLKHNLMSYNTLLSDFFHFKGHTWLLYLKKVMLINVKYLKISLSRIGSTDGSVLSQRLWFNIGILGADKQLRYKSSGWCQNDTENWESINGIEYSSLVKWNSFTQEKDVLVSGNCLTVSLVLSSFGPLFEYENRMSKEDTTRSLHPEKLCETEPEYDLVINVKDRLFRTQQKLLQIFCPIMASMIYTRETDGRNEILYLPDCDPKAFEIFLIFANSGELSEMTCDVAGKVYYIADKYDIPDLKKNCFRHLRDEISIESVCACLDLASRHDLRKLKERATDFFVKNARDIYHSPEWLQFMVTNTKLANDLIIQSYNNK